MDSNGYIMLDFSPIDFSKKNQVIYGLFDRISDVKAVNKFIIILNIQGNKTPLPAVMTYINNSYVIESFLYNFTITSDDNIRIDNVSADIIKDGIISAGATWSSQKISDELANIPLIDDTDVSDNTTWSSEKINDEIDNIQSLSAELINISDTRNITTTSTNVIDYTVEKAGIYLINAVLHLSSNYTGGLFLYINNNKIDEDLTRVSSYFINPVSRITRFINLNIGDHIIINCSVVSGQVSGTSVLNALLMS